MKRGKDLFYLCNEKIGGFSRTGFLLTLLLAVILLFAGYHFFYIQSPEVKGIEAINYLSADNTIKLTGENIKEIEASIQQGGKTYPLLKDAPDTDNKSYSIKIKPKDLGMTDGKAAITIKAKAGIMKKVQYDREVIIDTVPPTIDITAAPPYISPGGSGFCILKASGEDSVFIQVVDKNNPGNDNTFKAFNISSDTYPNNAQAGRKHSAKPSVSTYYVMFPALYDINEGGVFYAVATDLAGNRSIRALPTRLKMTRYISSSINIDDSFIKRVVYPLLNETNMADIAGAFKKVNEELRRQSLNKLIEISKQTEPKILWEGGFLQLKNSKVMAKYGDMRTYLYNRSPISKSVHLGYDLASLENAPVEAANSGIVRFAGDLSIYGNTVIIDHGLGLMSLYGHLSTMSVREGQKVSKGEIIANTGATGLAGGDHLHFGLLIQGYEVSPLYWWDPHWIKVNITDYFQQ
ncbi:MAG: M23 family metallopeptidase [Nitrospirota bacterium]